MTGLSSETPSAEVRVFSGQAHVLIAVDSPGFILPVTASGPVGSPGQGSLGFMLPIPNAPSLVGTTSCAQCAFVDAGSPLGSSFTNGLHVVIVN